MNNVNMKTKSCSVCLRKECQNIFLYKPESRVSHSIRMRENGTEVYPKQSSLERCFY